MTTIVGNHGQLWTSTLSPHLLSPHLDFPKFCGSEKNPAKFPPNFPQIRKSQEGCGGLRGEHPGAFPKAGPIFQQPLPENARGPPKGVGHGGGRWKLNQVFSRFFKNPERTRLKPGKNPVRTRKKTCWKMWRVRRKLGIWWGRDGPGTYHSRTCQGKSPEKTRFNFSPTPSSPTPFGRSGKYPNLGKDSISCCQKLGEELSNLLENFSSKEFRTATAFSSFLIKFSQRSEHSYF